MSRVALKNPKSSKPNNRAIATKKPKASEQLEIRRLVDKWVTALRTKDVDGIMSHYASDVVVFDLVPPLESVGAEAYRKNWAAWFPTFEGPIGYELRELTISAGNGVAFCHSLNRITGKRTDGDTTDVWVRASFCWRKSNATWKIVHEHQSVPFYMDGSYRAAVDLNP